MSIAGGLTSTIVVLVRARPVPNSVCSPDIDINVLIVILVLHSAISIAFLALFALPLLRTTNERYKKVAKENLVLSTVALLTTLSSFTLFFLEIEGLVVNTIVSYGFEVDLLVNTMIMSLMTRRAWKKKSARMAICHQKSSSMLDLRWKQDLAETSVF